MSRISDSVYLHQLSIPGTHDSATGNGAVSDFLDSFARTQDLDLAAQFDAGVRAFDLRPSVSDGVLKIYHGIVETKLTFDEALSILCDRLDAYPTEFVVVTMRHEDDHESNEEKGQWAGLMNDVLGKEKYSGRFVDFENRLTLGDMRGKILLLSRDSYASKPIGGYITGWSHSAAFEDQKNGRIQGTSSRKQARLYMQDFYQTKDAIDTKLASISTLLDFSITINTITSDIWVINSTSGYSATFANSDAYRVNAQSTNISVVDYLSGPIHAGPTGVVYMDFAGIDKSGVREVNGRRLVDALIENNFRYTMRGSTSAIYNIHDSAHYMVKVENGHVTAHGRIDIYTIDGRLCASGVGRVSVTRPGIYIVRTSSSARKIVVE